MDVDQTRVSCTAGRFFTLWATREALFITAKIWKQLWYPSIGKWVNKLWYIQIMEYYSVLKERSYGAIKDMEET